MQKLIDFGHGRWPRALRAQELRAPTGKVAWAPPRWMKVWRAYFAKSNAQPQGACWHLGVHDTASPAMLTREKQHWTWVSRPRVPAVNAGSRS